MRVPQRMLLVYLIGGILPLLITSIYTNMQTRRMMVDLTEETQREELSLIASSIQESIMVVGNVTRLLSEDRQTYQLAETTYSNQFEFLKDVTNYTAIQDYLNYYQQDISEITIYLDNPSVEHTVIDNADNIAYLGDYIITQEWYQKASQLEDLVYWHYQEDANGYLSPRAARVVRDSNGDVAAVIAVTMQYSRVAEAINERAVDTFLFYNNSSMVYSNLETGKVYPFLSEKLREEEENAYSHKVLSGVEEYLLTYQSIKPQDSVNYYSLVSIQKYQEIMSNVNKINLRAFFPEILGMIISIVLIFSFAVLYDQRINQMRLQMHRVAQGEYDKVVPVGGNDEIGELYQELEQMMKDIQALMARVVEEQVQKEKLHTRQKEVEFKMLASQINPHFLYNTLETIRMNAVVNHQTEIEELVKMLARIMRYNIQVTDQMVTLKAELRMVQYYLKIQNYRFGDRITSEILIEEGVDQETLVMPLIVQPFVENAFIHGLEQKDSDGRLTIHVGMKGDVVEIIIEDNGVGMDYYTLGQIRKSMREDSGDQIHIGIRNVNQRLRIQYGEEYGVKIESNLGCGTRIFITFPYNSQKNA